MMGVITIELVLAPASILILGSTHGAAYAAALTAATNEPYRQQVGRGIFGADVTHRAGVLASEAANCT
jgi:hypothetical protein